MKQRAAQPYPPPDYAVERQAFQHAHIHVGAGPAGHWLTIAGVLSPLVIVELVKDAEKTLALHPHGRRRNCAGIGGYVYAHRIQQERQSCEQRQR
jgi:hypothetical protein